MNVKMRQEVEKKIATALIKAAIADGFNIDVNDGEETVLENSTDKTAIVAAMFSTDEDCLILRKSIGANKFLMGWVKFVYGNDGYDVISDYTTNLEHLMTEPNKISQRYS